MDKNQNKKNAVIVNGNLHTDLSDDFFLRNRAFRLGDGFFETVRVRNGKPHLWAAHYARALASAAALNLEVPNVFSEAFMLQSIHKLLSQNEIFGGGRLRFTFYREGEGTYRPTSNRMGYLLEVTPVAQHDFQLNDKGLSLNVFSEHRKSPGSLSAYKILGNHLSIQAAIWAQHENLDDALLLNSSGHIIEATSSNVFVVKNGELHTPAVADGCVAGVMRMAVINTAIRSRIPVFESELGVNDITFADEVFLSNSIRGIAWVGSFRNKRYYHKLSDTILQEIKEMELLETKEGS